MNALEVERAQYIRRIISELEQAGRGDKGPIIQRATSYLLCSKDKLYQEMTALGWESGRKRRKDKGESTLTREEAELIANLMRQSERDSGKRLMTIRDAIEIAHANGKLDKLVSESTVIRALRRHRLHPDQLTQMETTVQQRSMHPNHVWQFDVSICVLYYLRNESGLRVMPKDEFYSNKPKNLERIKNERVLRYLVTDHYSGAFFVRYYVAPGENTETITQFLFEAFCERSSEELMYGVPLILIWDAGSANIAHQTQHLLNMLEVRHIAHTPGRPWAKGQVESTHNLIERHFESRLAFMHVESIETLNTCVMKWSVGFQSMRTHSRHKFTRYGMWQTIRSEQLRIMPDVTLVKSLMQQTKPEVRKIRPNGLSISYAPKGYGSLAYSLAHIPHIVAGDEVQVYANPYKAPAIRVITIDAGGEEQTYEAVPIKRDHAGFNLLAPVIGETYASTRSTESDYNRRKLDKTAYGTDEPREVKKIRKRQVPAMQGEIDPMADIKQQTPPAFMQRKGTPMAMAVHDVKEQRLSFIGLLKQIKDRLNPSNEEFIVLKAALKQAYPDGATEQEIDEFTRQWEQGNERHQANAH